MDGRYLTDPYFKDGFSMVLTPHPITGTLGHYDFCSQRANVDNGGFPRIPSAVRISMGGAPFSLESIEIRKALALDIGGYLYTSTGFSQSFDVAGTYTFDGPDFTNITYFDLASVTNASVLGLGFDNIVLTVPEPSSTVVLGLMGMVLLHLRRSRV